MSGFDLSGWLAAHDADLIDVRRQLHAHPELGRAEFRTTALIRSRLEDAGLVPRVLPGGTGLVCDIGPGTGPLVALRADLDALPLPDEKDVPYRSTVPGVSHACGHDVHTTALLGAGLALAGFADAGDLPGRVRLLFQPAEELTPGGALDVVSAGGLDGVSSVFTLHCDPRTDIGTIGIRPGAITSAADQIEVHVRGEGGHTARPHLTEDVVFALSLLVTSLPGLLSRRIDPRAGLSVIWGHVHAGAAANVIPRTGMALGTVRVLDHALWVTAPELLKQLIADVLAPTGVQVRVDYRRGVPPVDNDVRCTEVMSRGVRAVLGEDALVPAEQSLGGEDFAWFLEHVPGALGRLGVRCPGDERAFDLHRGDFDVDERAVGIGVQALVGTALAALAPDAG